MSSAKLKSMLASPYSSARDPNRVHRAQNAGLVNEAGIAFFDGDRRLIASFTLAVAIKRRSGQ
jgi:hypothetical protein